MEKRLKWMGRPMKDSGVEWIGKIPESWNFTKLKYVSSIQTGNTPPKSDESNYSVKGIDWIKADKLLGIMGVSESQEKLSEKGASIARIAPSNSILVCCIGNVGKMGYSEKTVAYNQQINAITFDSSKIHWKYGMYYLSVQKEQQQYYQNGNVLKILNSENQKKVQIVVPTLLEQERISDALDEITSNINNIIEKTNQSIKAFKYYKQALITETVINGLTPSVSTKKSGIEWIGNIPEHWTVTKFKYVLYIRGRLGWKGLKADEYEETGHVLLATPNIKRRDIDFENVNYITDKRYEESPEIQLSIGDVLLVKDGSTLGIVNVVRYLPKNATVNSSIAVLTPTREVDSIFLYYLIQSDFIQGAINQIKSGMGVPHLFQKDIREFHFIKPPLEEQKQIAHYLDEKTAHIDSLIANKEKMVKQLEAYKESLIYEYVTGKKEVN